MQQYAEVEAKNNHFSRKYLKILFALGITFAFHEKLPYKPMESHECRFGTGYKKNSMTVTQSLGHGFLYFKQFFKQEGLLE